MVAGSPAPSPRHANGGKGKGDGMGSGAPITLWSSPGQSGGADLIGTMRAGIAALRNAGVAITAQNQRCRAAD